MNEQWVTTTLAPHVKDGYIILQTYPDGSPFHGVDIPTFVQLFSSVTNPTYDALVAADGGKMGYKPFLDQWKEEGLIE